MTEKPTAAQRLAARVAAVSTPKLIESHGLTLVQYYKAPLAEADPLRIVVDAITAELEQRKVEFNLCCYCPAPHHDERICDRTAPAPLIKAADVIMEGIARVQ